MGSGLAATATALEEFKATLDLLQVQWREGSAYQYAQKIPYFPLINLLNRAWQIREDDLDEIGDAMDRLPVTVLVTADDARRLRRVPPAEMEAGLLGANPRGLYGAH